MKIALVSPYAWDRPGGVQSHVRGLASALRRRDHEVLVVAPRSSRSTDASAGVAYSGLSIPIPANGSIAPIAFGPGAWRGWRRIQEDLRPDLVHVHEPLVPSLGFIATAAARAPVVGTFHASAPKSLGYAVARPVLGRVARRLAARIAVSDAARDLVGRYYPGDYETIPNGFDAARFERAASGKIRAGRRIVFVGRLEPRKGLDVLLRAALRMKDVELVVVGSGPEEGRCRTLARRAGLQVEFLGQLSDEELPAVLAAGDVFCSPALGGESFGIVLLEAMAAGVPVVCSDLPGYRSAAGDAARYVTPGNDEALAVSLNEVLEEHPTAERLRERGHERARMFDWDELAPRVEQVYEEALGG